MNLNLKKIRKEGKLLTKEEYLDRCKSVYLDKFPIYKSFISSILPNKFIQADEEAGELGGEGNFADDDYVSEAEKIEKEIREDEKRVAYERELIKEKREIYLEVVDKEDKDIISCHHDEWFLLKDGTVVSYTWDESSFMCYHSWTVFIPVI